MMRPWPILKRYDSAHLRRIAMPIGGIGTGTVSMGGRGDLCNWELVNRPAKGFSPPNTFLALYAKPAGGTADVRALEGVVPTDLYEGPTGCIAPNHGWPRFQECCFETAYPFARVKLRDPQVPLSVDIETFNPLVPGDADASGIPVAVLRIVLRSRTRRAVSAAVCANLTNFIGTDGTDGVPCRNINEYRVGRGLAGLSFRSEGIGRDAPQWGTMSLTCIDDVRLSYRTDWVNAKWGNSLLDFWEDFSTDGALENRGATGQDSPTGSLCASVRVPAGGTRALTFLLTWHFPNRQSWTPGGKGKWCSPGACASGPPTIGNHYTQRYTDAWDVAEKTAPDLKKLEAATVDFVEAFCSSDLPVPVKEAALFNLSTLRSQTCFRTPDGRFFGWEGVHNREGSCYGSCTHVWNYEQATAFLFGDLARSMRDTEFMHATREDGHMSFRVHLPLERATAWGLAAADGQMGCIMQLYRDWQISGDDEFLRRLWPRAKHAMEFCWISGGWDADRDGVMEGCQHNTMDVEYYGPNPQMGTWYLGALRAMEEMSRYLGESDFATTCRNLFDRGSRWIDENLFNGEYYEHEIRPPCGPQHIAPGLRHPQSEQFDAGNLPSQLGSGCLIDQLVGQYMAHVCQLGYLLDALKIRTALRSIRKYNFKPHLKSHFNHLRTFALADESAVVMASYPRGGRPKRPFPYFNEVMTGFEYTAAVGMLFEGDIRQGLNIIRAVRSRYDGQKRNPFDEAECGRHYARAMTSWAAVLALTGFHYSSVNSAMTFASVRKPTVWFWSNGSAFGTCHQVPSRNAVKVRIDVLHGQLKVARLTIKGRGSIEFERPKQLRPKHPFRVSIKHRGEQVSRLGKRPASKSASTPDSSCKTCRTIATVCNIDQRRRSHAFARSSVAREDQHVPSTGARHVPGRVHFGGGGRGARRRGI